jgi:glycyl-tRNA synthetase beta chain
VQDDPGLLAEVAGLVEWPVVLMGRIDARFMDLPPEVLTVSMRAHQKYFATRNAQGELANAFITVANIETADNGAAIVAGNERVLRARLSDAEFFWKSDRQVPLGDRVADLDGMIFHAKLGAMRDKVERIEALAVSLSDRIAGADRDKARSAAYLAKADLTTGMVDEFPELQGVMGWYYARHDGEAPEVCDAVAAHYSPLGPSDACPHQPVSVAVALADKLDTLAGFFAVDEKPTGSKDPFALRRAALGVIRLIVENELRLPLGEVIAEALRLQVETARSALHDRAKHKGQDPARLLTDELLHFLADRLKVVLRDRGVRHDLIAAVFGVERPEGGPEDDLSRLLVRVEALRAFLESDDGANLLTAYRRAANIVRIESKKDKTAYTGEVDPAKLSEPAEIALFDALTAAEGMATDAVRREHFTDAMAAMAALRQPVDAFFDDVTVNAADADLRRNRLSLLARIGATLARVADFDKIEG